nr:DUF2339 domain-containing protein [Bacteroidota bacterium]
MLILSNSFIFYGLGYSALNNFFHAESYLGLFTLGNALLHAVVSIVVHRQKLYDRNLFYMVAGLALIFITIAIPVQLDGNWVTLLWAGESALLFWIGRNRQVGFYEKLSYGLMLLAFTSMAGDWTTMSTLYNIELEATRITPFFHISFLTSLLSIGCFVFILMTHRKSKNIGIENKVDPFRDLVNFLLPAVLLVSIYFTFRMEIATYWNQLYADSAKTSTVEGQDYLNYYWNEDYHFFKVIWIINYSLFFFTVLILFAGKYIRERSFHIVITGLACVTIIAFLSQGLYILSELRDHYIDPISTSYPKISLSIWIRYISYVFAAGMLFALHQYLRTTFQNKDKFKVHVAYDILLHVTILWVASSELITLMKLMQSNQSNKLGLSILWGVYALLLIALGIWKNKKYLRIGAIILFAVTLVKLVVYDLTQLDTISKTIVFVSLGLLLLIISFLYNKYKHLTNPDLPQEGVQ